MGDLRRGGKQIHSSRFLIHRLGCPFAAGLALSNTPSVYPPISPTRPRMGRSSAVEYCEWAPDSKLPRIFPMHVFPSSPLYAADLDCCLQKGPKGRRPSGEEEGHAHSRVRRPVYLYLSSLSHKLILFSHIASSESVEEDGGEGEAIINSTTSSGGGESLRD